ncbi:MAG: hypothetical protein EZS28_000074, partial [Streblomastix strix]
MTATREQLRGIVAKLLQLPPDFIIQIPQEIKGKDPIDCFINAESYTTLFFIQPGEDRPVISFNEPLRLETLELTSQKRKVPIIIFQKQDPLSEIEEDLMKKITVTFHSEDPLSFIQYYLKYVGIPAMEEFGKLQSAYFASESCNVIQENAERYMSNHNNIIQETKKLIIEIEDEAASARGEKIPLFKSTIIDSQYMMQRVEEQFDKLDALITTPEINDLKKLGNSLELIKFWRERDYVLHETIHNMQVFPKEKLNIERQQLIDTQLDELIEVREISKTNSVCLQPIIPFLVNFLESAVKDFSKQLRNAHVFVRLLFSACEFTEGIISLYPLLDLFISDFVTKAREHILYGTDNPYNDYMWHMYCQEESDPRPALQTQALVQAIAEEDNNRIKIMKEKEEEKLAENKEQQISQNDRKVKDQIQSSPNIDDIDDDWNYENEFENSDDVSRAQSTYIDDRIVDQNSQDLNSSFDQDNQNNDYRPNIKRSPHSHSPIKFQVETNDTKQNILQKTEIASSSTKFQPLFITQNSYGYAYPSMDIGNQKMNFSDEELLLKEHGSLQRVNNTRQALIAMKDAIIRCFQRTNTVWPTRKGRVSTQIHNKNPRTLIKNWANQSNTTSFLTLQTVTQTGLQNQEQIRFNTQGVPVKEKVTLPDFLTLFAQIDEAAAQCVVLSSLLEMCKLVSPFGIFKITGTNGLLAQQKFGQIHYEFKSFARGILSHPRMLFTHTLYGPMRRARIEKILQDTTQNIAHVVLIALDGTRGNAKETVEILSILANVVKEPQVMETLLTPQNRSRIFQPIRRIIEEVADRYGQILRKIPYLPLVTAPFSQILMLRQLITILDQNSDMIIALNVIDQSYLSTSAALKQQINGAGDSQAGKADDKQDQSSSQLQLPVASSSSSLHDVEGLKQSQSWTEEIKQLKENNKLLLTAINESFRKRIQVWISRLEVYNQDQFQVHCLAQEVPGYPLTIYIQLDDFIPIIQQFFIAKGFGATPSTHAIQNIHSMRQLLHSKQRLGFFLNLYHEFHRTVPMLHQNCLSFYVGNVERQVLEGLTSMMWNKSELATFVQNCITSYLELEFELRSFGAYITSYRNEIESLKTMLVFRFPNTVLKQEALGEFFETTFSKQAQEMKYLEQRLRQIKHTAHSNLRAHAGQARLTSGQYNYGMSGMSSVQTSQSTMALDLFFEQLDDEKSEAVRSYVNETLRYILERVQQNVAIIEVPLVVQSGNLVYRLGSSKASNEQSGYGMEQSQQENDDKKSNRSGFISRVNSLNDNLEKQSLIMNSPKSIQKYNKKEKSLKEETDNKQDNINLMGLFDGIMIWMADLIEKDKIAHQERIEKHKSLGIQSDVGNQKIGGQQKEGKIGKNSSSPFLVHKTVVDEEEEEEIGQLKSQLSKELIESEKRCMDFREGLMKYTPLWTLKAILGWVCVDTALLKQELFSLSAKWRLPFSQFLIGGIERVVTKSIDIITQIKRQFDSTFLHYTTAQKVKIVNWGRDLLRDVEKMDVFFLKLRVRMAQHEQSASSYFPHLLRTKVTEAEQVWRTYKRAQMKTYLDHIQIFEREVMYEILERERVYNRAVSDMTERLHDKEQTPLDNSFSSEQALEMLKLISQDINSIVQASDEITQLRREFIRTEAREKTITTTERIMSTFSALWDMWSVIHATRTQVEGALFSWEWSDLQKDTTLTANQF